MEYKRYDKDSIIIANVKKELEKHLGDYFVKEGDTFLTKGWIYCLYWGVFSYFFVFSVFLLLSLHDDSNVFFVCLIE